MHVITHFGRTLTDCDLNKIILLHLKWASCIGFTVEVFVSVCLISDVLIDIPSADDGGCLTGKSS